MPSPSAAAPQAPCSGALPQRQQQQEDGGGGAALIPEHLIWTARHEERLRYVQRQLTAAQAAWSEEQELWIDE
ncbi:MAG: hypothetical protein LQ348_002713, partial [Seirophora lacunosa]